MDFSASSAKKIYSDRSPHLIWEQWCTTTLMPKGKDIADIGCGGGIYTRAFAMLGAKSVVGVDNSSQYIVDAEKASIEYTNVAYVVAEAKNTGLESDSIDIAFERALIHHFPVEAQENNIIEIKRILRGAGILAVQDRTYEDVISSDPAHWVRATLFECFPQLLQFEKSRRPHKVGYKELLERLHFHTLKIMSLIEVRRVYSSFQELEKEILERKGKSILFELNDQQLKQYCLELKRKFTGKNLEEIDQWTIWLAKAP